MYLVMELWPDPQGTGFVPDTDGDGNLVFDDLGEAMLFAETECQKGVVLNWQTMVISYRNPTVQDSYELYA